MLSLAPGWLYPSIVTASVIAGSGVSGEIVCTPEPGMLNVIVSAPAVPFAATIASRREPAPVSFVFVTRANDPGAAGTRLKSP